MIRLYNARLLFQKEKHFEVKKGEVFIENGIITDIILENEPCSKTIEFEQEIDCNEDLLMPGFCNMHTHSPMVFLRSIAENLPLKEWLNEAVFPHEALLTKEDVYVFSQLAMFEYLKNGITSIFDMYHMDEETVRAARECGMRMLVCGNINDFTGSVQRNREKLLRQYHDYTDDMVSFRLGCHAEYTCNIEQLQMLSELCHTYKLPVFAHMSETKEEVDACRARYHMTPVELFDHLGLFDYGGGIFHGVWLSEQDLAILKDKKVGVISNPASNLKLASGIADLCKLEEAGITIGLGTDGAASNNSLDLFKEMFLAASLQKILRNDAVAISAEHILYAALYGGADITKLYGTNEKTGLMIGACADLILIDLHAPNLWPQTDIANLLVYSGNASNVRMTMIRGQIRYMDGTYHVPYSLQEVKKSANSHLEALLRRKIEM